MITAERDVRLDDLLRFVDPLHCNPCRKPPEAADINTVTDILVTRPYPHQHVVELEWSLDSPILRQKLSRLVLNCIS